MEIGKSRSSLPTHDLPHTLQPDTLRNDRLISIFLLISLFGLAVSLFFSQSGIAIFGIPYVLLMALGLRRHNTPLTIPRSVLIAGGLLILDLFASALASDNIGRGLSQFKEQWYILFVVLPFLTPLERSQRMKVILVFFSAAAFAGLFGIAQYATTLFGRVDRAHGMTHPIHYAHILAFASSAAIIGIALRSQLRYGRGILAGLIFVAAATSGGILLSGSRGVIIAFFLSCMATLLIINWRRALVFVLIFVGICIPALTFDSGMRARFASVITSWQTEDESGSTGNRLELWEGSLIIFRSSPLAGTGIGDFETDIKKLIAQGEIRPIPVTVHAHNIYLQALATQGVIGLSLLLALLLTMLLWGYPEMRRGNPSGCIIVASTLLIVIGGLSENNLGVSKVFAAWCFTIGMFGQPLASEAVTDD